MESYITDIELVEGLLASSVWATFFIYFKKHVNMSVMKEGALAWIGVWFIRKLGLSLYLSLKKRYDLPLFKLRVLPYPEIMSNNKPVVIYETIGIILAIIFWILLIWSIDHYIFKSK